MNYSIKNHKEKQIIYCNYNNCKSDEEMIKLSQEVYSVAKERQTENGHLILCNFSGVKTSKQFLETSRNFGPQVVEISQKIAVIGVIAARRFLIDSYALVTGMKYIKHFNNEKEALSWLVQ